MKRLLPLLLVLLALATAASAQISSSTTYRIYSGTALPATCDPGPETTDVFIKTSATQGIYFCSATNTWSNAGAAGSGTVTGVSFTGGLISVTDPTAAAALTVAGTSGGVVYFSSASTWASSAALAANAIVIGGGAGVAPSTTTTGTGVLTALGVNVGSAGAFVVNGGALGTPSSGIATNITGLPISTGVSGLGTGVATALAINTGSAGAVVLFNGAGGTPSSLTLTNATGLPPTTGISGWPANASGVLTNNGSGTLSWGAGGSGITIGTTTVTSGTATRLLYETSGNVVGEISGATSDGTNLTTSSGALRATSPRITTSIFDANGLAIISLNPTASAVNSLQVTNGATGSPGVVALAAIGSDSDVRLTLTPKGTAGVRVISGVTTGSGTTAGFQVAVDSLTTGQGASFSSSSVTSGSVVNITSTSTAAASSTLKGLDIAISGANGTPAQTVTGASISVTNTNATSGTNVALTLTASGAASVNTALIVTAGQIQSPNGTSSLPAYAFGSASNSGFWFDSAWGPSIVAGGTKILATNGTYGVILPSTLTLGWGPDALVSLPDLRLRRAAAANLAFGAADAASPVAQTLSVQSVVAGTSNTAGVDWTKKASAGTGTGVGGSHVWQVAPAGGSGTSQNSFVEAMRITGAGVIQYPTTVTAGGTTGNQTINKVSGTVNIAAAGTTVTVTNSLVSANSICFGVVRTNDTTAVLKNIVPGAGSFVITMNAAVTAETSVGFFCINP